MINSGQLEVIVLYPILETTSDYFCEILLKKLIVLLLISSATMFADAANWVNSGSNPSKGAYTYVDTESISTQGNYKQAFFKGINIPAERYVIALRSYDCKSNPKRTKTTYITMFDLEENVIASNSVNESFNPVLPESLGEIAIGIVCNF